MIVYVESNFVLELAYLQETRSACAGILALAEAGSISMVVPAFCLIECRMSWSLKAKRRAIVNEDLQSQIRELARSAPYTNIIEQSREITAALIESSEEDRRR